MTPVGRKGYLDWLRGIGGAPLFLWLAGVGMALAGAARMRRGWTREAAAASLRRRGWQIVGLAFLFRLQS